MTKITNSIVNLIGNTPIVKLNRVVPEDAADAVSYTHLMQQTSM